MNKGANQMNPQEAAYILNNLSSIESLNANCGELELTPDMVKAVEKALAPILLKIINHDSPGTKGRS